MLKVQIFTEKDCPDEKPLEFSRVSATVAAPPCTFRGTNREKEDPPGQA